MPLIYIFKMTAAHLILAIHVRRGCAGQGSGSMRIIGNGEFWKCDGDELCLLDVDCRHNSRIMCDHRMDAGVYCSGKTVKILQANSVKSYCKYQVTETTVVLIGA